jgi:ABC-type multidrug transport system ATPase subunit
MSLVVSGLKKRLGGREVLRGIDCTVADGECVAVFGANGAGKSTLLATLAGILDADAGHAELDGAPLTAARADIGWVPEAADPPPHLAADELVDFVAALRRRPRPPADTLSRLGWSELAARRIGAMSLGQRRRACLGAALVGPPRLLLLDEPTNGLDATAHQTLCELLREHLHAGRSALVATHDTAFAATLGARIVTLTDGKL